MLLPVIDRVQARGQTVVVRAAAAFAVPALYEALVRYRSVQYQTASWDRPRRAIANIEHHLGELFPPVGFIVPTLTGTNRAVVHVYNQRGTAEGRIKAGKEATESYLTGGLFRQTLGRIGRLAWHPT